MAGPVYTEMPLVDLVSVHWDTTVPPIEYLQGTLDHRWKNFSDYCSLHRNTTGGTVTAHTHPGTYS